VYRVKGELINKVRKNNIALIIFYSGAHTASCPMGTGALPQE
jgi:hypothetical protein